MSPEEEGREKLGGLERIEVLWSLKRGWFESCGAGHLTQVILKERAWRLWFMNP